MRIVLAGLLLVVGACGCTASSGATAARMMECGFYTEGEVRMLPLYVPDDCYDACFGGASCEELSAAVCGESIDLLLRCDGQCAYRCPEGELIRRDQECDGIENCEGGADEVGCGEPPAPCRSPTQCDGIVECDDGRDEEGCVPFVCDDGTGSWVRERNVRCNGYRQCSDGSDEEGCARFELTCD